MALKTLKSEMERVRKAHLGEVILFNQKNHTLLRNLIPDFGHTQLPVKGVLFHGILGIYNGMADLGTYTVVGDEKVKLELKRKHNYELALINQGGVVVPFIRIPMAENCMILEDYTYIGPKEISKVLENKCEGYFKKFFDNYVKVHRKV